MSRKSAKQAVFQTRADEPQQLDSPDIAPSSMNTVTKFKYVDVGLNEYAQIMFKELSQIAERVEEVQNRLVAMQNQIDILETC